MNDSDILNYLKEIEMEFSNACAVFENFSLRANKIPECLSDIRVFLSD